MAELGIDGYDNAVPLGRGGFGTVFRARQVAFNRTVAIKVFNAEVAGTESMKTFERECRAIGQLDWCPSIVTVFSSGRTTIGEPYIVMEYAPGGSLAAHLAAGPLDESAARRIMARIALALATAHDAGILHRDVKPANILVSRSGEPVLADFGIARLFSGGATTTGNVAGTVAYAAPETWLDTPASPQSDIFSLGATIFATLTGHGPFSDKSQASTATLLARAMATTELDVDVLPVSAEFRSILRTCLRRDPAARYGTARELLDAVAPFGLATTPQIPVLRSRDDGAKVGGSTVPGFDATRLATRSEPGTSRRWSPEFYRLPATAQAADAVVPDEVWPSATDYARLIQAQAGLPDGSPFGDATLVRDALGMPMSASGQNAIVFEFAHRGGPIAVRCFTRRPVGAGARYQELGGFLARHDVVPFVPSVWVPRTVADGRRAWPVVVMPWVDGVPLNLAVEDMLDRPDELRRLACAWREVVTALVEAGVAHGDVQCGNVLVGSDRTLNLVDMDGVYVPGMATPPTEVGHPNFQHPGRGHSHWGPEVDAFSFLVMTLSLEALAADPGLWRHHNGENLILTKEDFVDRSAAVWGELSASPNPEVVRLAEALLSTCATTRPPRLATVLKHLGVTLPEAGTAPVAATSTAATPRRAAADPVASVPLVATLAQTADARLAETIPQDLTVKRPAAAVPAAPAAPAQWWADEPVAVTPPAATPRPQQGAPSSGTIAATQTARPTTATRRGGRNAILIGALGGLGAGLLASVLQAAFSVAMPPQFQVGLFLILVGGLLGGALAALPSAVMGSWNRAARLSAVGAASGAGFALAGLGLFEAVVALTMPLYPGRAPFGFLLGGWLTAAVAVGMAAGVARRSMRATLSGVYGGVVGGVLGALLHSSSSPFMIEYEESAVALWIEPLLAGTLVPVLLACAAIGAAIGTVDRLRRRHWLTIIEGRGRGLELILDRDLATIGSDRTSTLHVAAPGILPRHVDLSLGTARPTMRAHGPVEHNGTPIHSGAEVPLTSGDVLRIGPSYVRVESRVGASA
jgi:RIO-like serine/threonine protein kinase